MRVIKPERVEDIPDEAVTEAVDTLTIERTEQRLTETRAGSVKDQAAEVGQLRGQGNPARTARIRTVDEQDGRTLTALLDSHGDAGSPKLDVLLRR